MRPILNDSGASLTEQRLRSAEHKLKLSLPVTYRQFLLTRNGGVPTPNVFRHSGLSLVIDLFFEIGAREKYRDLVRNFKQFRKRLPEGALPIALDAFGNLICLAAKGEHTGKLYFWDHEMPKGGYEDPVEKYPELFADLEDDEDDEDDEDGCESWPGWPALTLIADNLDEFLDGFVNEG